MEEYNSLPTTQNHKQGATKLLKLKLLNKYLLMVTFENGENSLIQFESSDNKWPSIRFNSK